MSGIGFWELVLVFLIGLIVLGPERLPRVAHQLGTWLGQARRMTRMMKRQLEDELNLEKEPAIKPPPRALPRAPLQESPAEKDDTWSPAHEAHAPGTGVASESARAEESGAPAAAPGEHDEDPQTAEPPAQERAS